MKKKTIALLLSAAMIMTSAAPAYAAEFFDGTLGTEVSNDSGLGNDSFDFTDSAPVEDGFASVEETSEEEMNLFSDSQEPTIEPSTDVPALQAQRTYQISVSGELIYSETQKFVDMLNAERAKLGKPPVSIDQEMMDIATERVIQGSVAFGHETPEGGQLTHNCFENASGKFEGTAEAFLNGWKGSAAHWVRLIDTKATRLGFVIYHHKGVDNYYYGYTISKDDHHKPGNTLVPYTGNFSNQKVNSYPMNIIPQYLQMKKIESTVTLSTTFLLTPEFKAYDVHHNGAWEDMGYEFGSGSLDNDNGYWESDNPSVVSVDTNGNCKALKEGTANIRFYVNGDKDKYYQNTVTVKNYGGWFEEDGFLYYRDPDGYKVDGWMELDGKKYHFVNCFGYDYETLDGKTNADISGVMNGAIRGTSMKIDGVWYSFDKNGAATRLNGRPETSTPETVAKPSTPSAKASVSGYTSARLTWKKTSNTKGYQVYKYNSKTRKYNRIRTLSASATSFTEKLGYGKTAKYKVRAYNKASSGKTVYGNFSSVKTVKTAPAVPSVTKLSNASKRKLKLTWKRPSGAEGYVIYRKAGKNGSYKKIKTVTSAKTLSYTNSGLKKGTTYYYKIRAYRKGADKKNIYGKWSKVIVSTCR